MPFFSIYTPKAGPLHYLTITLIGFQRGLAVRWNQQAQKWYPQVIHLDALPSYTGSKLEGYQLTLPADVDDFALKAMTNEGHHCP